MKSRGPERLSTEELYALVSELYAAQVLDHEKLELDRLGNLYDKASKLVVTELGVKEQREWSNYGSGFASFFDSWFYSDDTRFCIPPSTQGRQSYRGVFVIFSMLTPMFAVGESTKEWDEETGASYLPNIQMLDVYESDDVRVLSQRICRILRDSGVPQVSRRTLENPIDASIQIDSNLSHGPLTLFDAFYQWMD